MVTISIIIPVYNVEQYVRRCIESIMTQDVVDASIECIVIDDCSLDNSMVIVLDVISKYKGPIRFLILRHEINRGLSAARNTGLKHATGDYILFVDSDDFMYSDSVRYFVKYLTMFPDIDMIVGNVTNIKSGKHLIPQIVEPLFWDNRNIFFQKALRHEIYLYAWNKLIKRQILIAHEVFFEEGIIYEDQCWSYQLFSTISSVLLLPKVTYVYEYNLNSIVNTTFSVTKAENAIRSYTISINKMLDSPPRREIFSRDLTVDYYLFLMYFLLNGVDLQYQFRVSKDIENDFLKVRKRLLLSSVQNFRLIISSFLLILFPPFSRIQKVKLFRRHYDQIEYVVNRIGHLVDFLHRK